MRQLLTSLHALAHRLGSQVALIRLRWPDIFHILRGGPDRGPSVHRLSTAQSSARSFRPACGKRTSRCFVAAITADRYARLH